VSTVPARRQLRLADGRRIDYLDLGDPAGRPLLYLHGTPSSAREVGPLEALAADRGVRLIAPDRPGYLDSQAARGADVRGVAADLLELADLLGFERFAVAGFSGGAGIALAVGAAAPARVSTVLIGGGMGAFNSVPDSGLPALTRVLFAAVALQPRIGALVVTPVMQIVARRFRKDLADPRAGVASALRGAASGSQLPAVDAYVDSRSDDELRAELADRVRSFQSARGIVLDVAVYARDWRIDLASLTMPVEIWHGTNDPAVPLAFAKALDASLPDSRLHVLRGRRPLRLPVTHHRGPHCRSGGGWESNPPATVTAAQRF